MISKKSQSAMEYLMTYGWAILVVLIALGALFYLGVFSPKTPNVCTINAPFSCQDAKYLSVAGATNDVLTMSIGATGISADVPFGSITVKVNGLNDCTEAGTISATSGAPSSITCTGYEISKGNKYSGTIDITYTLTGSTISHTTQGQFSGTVE